jgi:hypothetical protein
MADSATPLTDLLLALWRAVDCANALPKSSVDERYEVLIGAYIRQIVTPVVAARIGQAS